MNHKNSYPQAIFDTNTGLIQNDAPLPAYIKEKDYLITRQFLLLYKNKYETYHSYRRELDRFLQWLFLIARKELNSIGKNDIENFVMFCKKPPNAWISTKMAPRFILVEGKKVANPEWRPFVVKSNVNKSKQLQAKHYRFSDSAIKAVLRVLSSFFNFLELEDYIRTNPVRRLRQKQKLLIQSAPRPSSKLTTTQWDDLLETAEILTEVDKHHERSLFLLSLIHGLKLSIADLKTTTEWEPQMRHFYEDDCGEWRFIKRSNEPNHSIEISLNRETLKALKRYRRSLKLSSLPAEDDYRPILPKRKGQGGISSTRQLRDLVHYCIQETIIRLKQGGDKQSAEAFEGATIHWLRSNSI